MTGTPAQFRAFFDDAPTFPPGLAPLPDAVAHRLARRGRRLVSAVGPLVISLADLDETARLVADAHAAARVAVSPVVPPGALAGALAAARRVDPWLETVSLELKTSPDADAWVDEVRAAAEAPMPVFVELTLAQVAAGGVAVLAEQDLRLKFRTGGVEAALFPTVEDLAEVIVEAVARGVPFKLTAGLHEAIRHDDPATGFTHHGFLNVAAATQAARAGAGGPAVVDLLAERDPEPIVAAIAASDGAWRESFRSFGTCSVAEPAASLHRLGLFPAGLT